MIRKVYSMSTRRDSGILDWMYESYLEGLRRYLRSFVIPGLVEGFDAYDDDVESHIKSSRMFIVEWIRFKMICATLNAVFKYLDRYYVSNNLKSSLIGSSYPLFRVLIYDPYRQQIRQLLYRLTKYGGDSTTIEFLLQAMEEIDHKSSNHFTRGCFYEQDVQSVNQALIQDNLQKHNVQESRDVWRLIDEYIGPYSAFELGQEVMVNKKRRARVEEIDNDNQTVTLSFPSENSSSSRLTICFSQFDLSVTSVSQEHHSNPPIMTNLPD
jgi:hypothetical protein